VYREGASHPANEIAVANGQVDLAIDYDRNLNAMMERGLIKADQVKIVWTSDPLPNERGWPAPSPCSGAA
jgi:phosphonate transport system substrate-binding protein